MSATRTLTVTLQIKMRDMTQAELEDAHAFDMDDEDEGVETVADLSPHSIAELIPGTLKFSEIQDEMFAGSGVFVRIEDVEIEFAGWELPDAGRAALEEGGQS